MQIVSVTQKPSFQKYFHREDLKINQKGKTKEDTIANLVD